MELLRLNKPEARYLVLGCITSVLIGGIQSGFAIAYSEMYDVRRRGLFKCLPRLSLDLSTKSSDYMPLAFFAFSQVEGHFVVTLSHIWIETTGLWWIILIFRDT